MATLSDLYTHLKTLCEQWFYNKSTVDTYLNNKVDKETGKGLSSNDYTTAEKTKLSGIEAEANKTTVDSALSSTSTNPLQNKAINTALSSKADSTDIPTKTSDLTNDGADGTNVFVANNDTRLSDARTPTSHTHGQVTNDGKITSSAVTVASGDNIVITDASDSSKLKKVANVLATHIKDSNAHSNIGTSASATQGAINTAIDTAIGNLSSIQAIQVVSALPTASSSTMGKLYIVSESSKVNVYYTEEDNGSYSWHKMDTDILDELSVDWSDIENKPTTFTPSGHTHYTNAVQEAYSFPNIGTQAGDSQYIINDAIDTAIGDINTSLSNKASSSHTHNNITNDGKVTVTGTNGGNLVVTNSSNEVIVESAIDVLDGVVQSLISYGNS